MATDTKCVYCGADIESDGICSRPCKMGELERKVEEARKAVAAEKKSTAEE